jgi:hypothetical protein
MTFEEKYKNETSWYGKAMIMEIYHLAMTQNYKWWTITRTAEYFGVSIGLASENLRLAHVLHVNPDLIAIPSRSEALKYITRYSNKGPVMAEMWKPKSPEILKQWITDVVEEASDRLTVWEMKFISDMEVRVNNGQQLTEQQEKKLEEIYADKTS